MLINFVEFLGVVEGTQDLTKNFDGEFTAKSVKDFGVEKLKLRELCFGGGGCSSGALEGGRELRETLYNPYFKLPIAKLPIRLCCCIRHGILNPLFAYFDMLRHPVLKHVLSIKHLTIICQLYLHKPNFVARWCITLDNTCLYNLNWHTFFPKIAK